MDFTVQQYIALVEALLHQGYTFQTFENFIQQPKPKSIVLRHDVDLLPQNSLVFAQIQSKMGIQGTYYFRAVPESWDETIISEIAALGHEIGYHYECLTTWDGDLDLGINDFKKNLTALRKLAPVTTICMHGSPMSKHDSKALWDRFTYRDYGIIAEPYFDVDYNQVFYLTDTGRKWDGHTTSVRDKVATTYTQTYHSTAQIITAAQAHTLPDQILFTFHPQRWNDNVWNWSKELVLQNIKNVVKKTFFVNA